MLLAVWSTSWLSAAAVYHCSVVKQAQDFESQATHVLTRGRDITTFAHAIEASELERLLLDTERLGLKVSEWSWSVQQSGALDGKIA
jgi:hypothetical protein